jgi:fatty-acyl-CoA synthase
VLVNINPAYRTAEVEYALNKVGCKALVSMPRSRPATIWACCASWRPSWRRAPGQLEAVRLPTLRTVVWIDVADEGDDQPGMLRFRS